MTSSTADSLAAFGPHDHDRCRGRTLAAASDLCRARGLKLTRQRAFALEALVSSHRAMTAYELLDRLRAAGLGAQPPAAYRALEFLVENGLAHRIERLGAYVACALGGCGRPAGFVVCRRCRRVAESELADMASDLSLRAGEAGFSVERVVLEVEGLCAACAGAEP